jgi:hypothetical protein
LVQDICERFGVHQPVLDGHVQQLIGHVFQQLVEFLADPAVVPLHLCQPRPISWLVGWQFPRRRIDAEGKKPVKSRVKRGHVQRVARDQVPIEGFHVAHIKEDAMALRDGPLVKGIGPDAAE